MTSFARPSAQNSMRGMMLFALSSTFFGLMAFCVKLSTQQGIPGAEVAMLRFAIGLLPVLLIPSVRSASFRWQRFDLLFYRGFFGGLAVLFYFTAIAHIPVGVATLLNYTTPVFSGVYAASFAGEPIRARAFLPLLIALSGVVLVVSSTGTGKMFLGFGKWELLGLGSAVCPARR